VKWLFALLLLANVALFMWGQWYRQPLVRPSAPPPDVAQEKIKLLNEPGVRLLLRSRNAPAAPVPTANVASRCFRLGPFEQAAAADDAGRRLRAAGFEFRRESEEDTRPVAWHVYLPPLPSREAAERRRRELTRLGFRDHALIQEAGLENGISLGVFSVEDNARARVEQLARRDVRAQVRAIPGTRTVYWLSLAPAPEGVGALEALVAREWGGAEPALRPTPCPPAPGTRAGS